MANYRHIPWSLSSLAAIRLVVFGMFFLASTVIPLPTLGHGMSNVECRMLAVASGLLTAETHSIDHLGNATTSRTFIDRDYKTVFHLTTTPASTQASGTITVNGLLEESTSSSGHTPPTTPPTTSITPFAPTYDQ